MPYKEKLCGVYEISTPNGSRYIGSSTNIHGRWSEHRYHLKKGTHHSQRLLAAYQKHGDLLKFEVLEICSPEDLNEVEQSHINRIEKRYRLNTSNFVANPWLDPEVRSKFEKAFSSDEMRAFRRDVASRPRARWVPIVCSDGREFRNMAEAGRAFGVQASRIKGLSETQYLGKIGVKFRKASDVWGVVKKRTRKPHSDETRQKLSAAKMGRPLSDRALTAAAAKNKRPVISTCLTRGVEQYYSMIKEAAEKLRPGKWRTANSQIVKACTGVKANAYGYKWRYADAAA